MANQLKPYCQALRILADEVLTFHTQYIWKEPGLIVTLSLKCKLNITKLILIIFEFQPLRKYFVSKQ